MSLKTENTEWDLNQIIDLTNPDAEKEAIERARLENSKFVEKWKSDSSYLSSPEKLKEALSDLSNFIKNHSSLNGLSLLYSLKLETDQANPELKAKITKLEEIENKIVNERKFFTLSLSKLDKDTQEEFLKSPELEKYKHFLEKIFISAPHYLSEELEKALSLKEATAHDAWERMTQSLITKQEKEILLKGKKQTKNFSELLTLLENPDEKVRKEAAKALNEIFDRYSEIAEPEINAIVLNKKINDNLRSFHRPDSSRILVDDISEEIVDNLLSAIKENFHISHKYYQLLAKIHKKPKLEYYEKNISNKIKGKDFPFPEACRLVDSVFSSLDPEFGKIFQDFLQEKRIDAFPRKGKQNGAFCLHDSSKTPTFVLLNHTNTLKDVTTLAHELGHGINSELMKKHQDPLNVGTPKSTAEVASIFFEDFVLEEVLKTADDEAKLSIMMEKLNRDASTIFRQAAFYLFEQELHKSIREKGYLSQEEIASLFRKHMAAYLGDSVNVENAGNWWIYVPHFRYFFYVYSYTSGHLISSALQNLVREDKEYIKEVKRFLSSGTRDSPENIFKSLGLDITKKEFWLQGLKKTESLLFQTEELAKKLGKI